MGAKKVPQDNSEYIKKKNNCKKDFSVIVQVHFLKKYSISRNKGVVFDL